MLTPDPFAIAPRSCTAVACALLLLAAPSAQAALDVTEGFTVTSLSIAPGGALVGALDLLPNGNLVLFDGAAVVEVDPSGGTAIRTLYTPSQLVYPSFLRVDPTGTYVLFGENAQGELWRIPLDGGAPALVATVPFVFGCAFRGAGEVVLSHGEATWQSTTVSRLDVDSGALDPLIALPGPSGPVAFDAAGDLYYGTNDPAFPAPPLAQSILRFPAAALDTAIGPTALGAGDGTLFATGITAPTHFAFDGEGDLLVGDSIDGVILEFGPTGAAKGTLGVEVNGSSPSVGPMAFAPGPVVDARFAPYQPEGAGTLHVLSTDFLTFNDLNRVTPRRPSAATTPLGPIAAGPFTFALEQGPPNGFGLLFVALVALPFEVPVENGPTTFLVGFDPSTLVATAPVFLDATGALSVPATHPGGAFSLAVQAALWHPTLGPTGTTNLLPLTFR